MNTDTQQFAYKVAAVGVVAMPYTAMLLIGLFILLHDGVQAQQVLTDLTAIALGGSGVQSLTTVVSHIVGGQVAKAQASAGLIAPQVVGVPAPPVAPVAPPMPASPAEPAQTVMGG